VSRETPRARRGADGAAPDAAETAAGADARPRIPDASPRVLMLGMGWFPGTIGGLDRYYRSLFERLPEATGVVVGPAGNAPDTIHAASRQDLPLAKRLGGFWRAAQHAARGVEVVDAHFALYAAAPLLIGALRGRPAVFHFHGSWAEESVAAGDSSRVKHRLRRALERRVLRRADAHIVLSAAFRRVLVERCGVPPWGIHVWAPGVALDKFTPGDRPRARARLGIDPSAFVVVCARRLVPRMGIDGLLDAWAAIEHDLPDGSLLLVAGEGPLFAALSERAARPPLAGGVRMMGWLSDAELIDAYRCADVAAVPSVAVEGFGLVVLEAAACGTPSIVGDVGGLPEAASALDPSLVVAPGDTGALGARLRAAARGDLPTRTATRRYAERFDWASVAERHRALYRRLAGGEGDERLRVVYLDHVARLSGGEIALLRLLPHLRRVNAHVILGEEGPLVARLAQVGVSVEVLPFATAARDLRKDTVRAGGPAAAALLDTLTYVARLALRLRRLAPDLVHTNSLKAGVYGSLAAKAAGVPVVWHVRDRIAEDYLPRPAVDLVKQLVRHVPNGVVANSTATLDTLGLAGGDSLRWVIPDSVEAPGRAGTSRGSHEGASAEPEDFASAGPCGPASPGSRETTFGMVGRLAPWKGQDLFLRAFAAAFPGARARAVVVGSALFGEDTYERELRGLASRLGIDERVEFRGFREDVWRELASFDVLVHASVIPEPFGQVVLEGMAAGLAVIAPDEGGPAEVIADGETGRLFRSRDEGALASAMRAMDGDPAERERLGASARRAVEPYRPDAVAERLQRVYDRVIAVRRNPRHGCP
jgi:glycosyltransferase involved in cell wall biosynthesis